MADIRCSHCGNNNPDFLDVCQFCQSPLKPESMLHIGDEPIKRKTDELEEILPDWLKEARQQGRDEQAADEAFRSQTKPNIPKTEPPDLLAGLMSQADSDEDEVPEWLAGINPVADRKSSPKLPSAADEEPSDFFAQFKQPEPPTAPPSEPSQEEVPSWMGMEEKPSEQKDELTDWFAQTSAGPDAPALFDDSTGVVSDDNSWLRDLGSFDEPEKESPAEKEPEDLSWLRDLETASKGTGELSSPQQEPGFDFASSSSDEDLSWLKDLGGTPASEQPASSQEDLSWLNNLGGTPVPSFEEPAASQLSSAEDNLDWLKDLGGTPAPASEEPITAPPSSSDEDLDWLKDLGGTPAPSFEEPITAPPPSSDEDLDWLKDLGVTPVPSPSAEETAPSQPSSAQDDLDWLKNLGGTPETSAPAFADTGELYGGQDTSETSKKPFRTAPLHELIGNESFKDTTPDWLKDAMEDPGMPAPGAVSMDWFSEHGKPTGQGQQDSVPTQEEAGSTPPAFDFSQGDTSVPSAQDVDALFMEMPDWLSREPESAETFQPESVPAPLSDGESLSPVELPSWVQAMRPVDSSISDAISSSVDQITEREGPLAGFRGVIPSALIGSSLRPKALSLKLQVTEEQQTATSLLEQIIASETLMQPRKAAAGVSSQKVLRWVLSGLFLVVLGVVIGLGLQTMPIQASATANELSSLVAGVPDGAPVLVVVDYEPSFAGELEVAAGPLMDQLAMSRHSTFEFIAMSPTGSALVERLMFNTGIGKPLDAGGLGYQTGAQYFNLGFLPGGSAGVLGFIENPADDFSKYAAILLLTDNAETGRVWVEQLEAASPEIDGEPLLLVSSAQSGPLLQPYVDSGQVDIMINGLYDAAKYELVNVSRPGTARLYWDAFGYGIMMAVIAIVLGSLWNVFMRVREQRAEAEQG